MNRINKADLEGMTDEEKIAVYTEGLIRVSAENGRLQIEKERVDAGNRDLQRKIHALKSRFSEQ